MCDNMSNKKTLTASLLTIGNEITSGKTINTNASWLSLRLHSIGIQVDHVLSIRDDKERIIASLDFLRSESGLIIITGGLGPTLDDITKKTLCTYTDDTLIQNDGVLRHLEQLFKERNRQLRDVNISQSYVPSRCHVLHNARGTAPGMWLEHENTAIVSMPGVPTEMKGIFDEEVEPKLKQTYETFHIETLEFQTYNIPESLLAHQLHEITDSIPDFVEWAFLPSFGKVKIRLTAKSKDQTLAQSTLQDLSKKISSTLGISPKLETRTQVEKRIAEKLRQLNATLSTAESCTGGIIAHKIVSVPDASSFYRGGIVPYQIGCKVDVLGVKKQTIDQHNVVSEEVAIEMAETARKQFGTTYALSTTGVAGPSRGDTDKEIGTICIGVSTPKGSVACTLKVHYSFREAIMSRGADLALQFLFEKL